LVCIDDFAGVESTSGILLSILAYELTWAPRVIVGSVEIEVFLPLRPIAHAMALIGNDQREHLVWIQAIITPTRKLGGLGGGEEES
jgi:hypothetical protein